MLKTAIALTVLWTPAANLHAQTLDHSHADAQRQAEVAGRGKDVMPFSLAATTHVFSKTAEGGIQQVVAKTPEDATQVQLIRQHPGNPAEGLPQFERWFIAGLAHFYTNNIAS